MNLNICTWNMQGASNEYADKIKCLLYMMQSSNAQIALIQECGAPNTILGQIQNENSFSEINYNDRELVLSYSIRYNNLIYKAKFFYADRLNLRCGVGIIVNSLLYSDNIFSLLNSISDRDLVKIDYPQFNLYSCHLLSGSPDTINEFYNIIDGVIDDDIDLNKIAIIGGDFNCDIDDLFHRLSNSKDINSIYKYKNFYLKYFLPNALTQGKRNEDKTRLLDYFVAISLDYQRLVNLNCSPFVSTVIDKNYHDLSDHNIVIAPFIGL